jgi:hypothetical protein
VGGYRLRTHRAAKCRCSVCVHPSFGRTGPEVTTGNAIIIRCPFSIGQFRIDWTVTLGRLREFDEERSRCATQAVRVVLTSVLPDDCQDIVPRSVPTGCSVIVGSDIASESPGISQITVGDHEKYKSGGWEPRSPHRYPFQLMSTEAELQSAHRRLDMDDEAVYCGKLSKIAKRVDLVRVRVRSDAARIPPYIRSTVQFLLTLVGSAGSIVLGEATAPVWCYPIALGLQTGGYPIQTIACWTRAAMRSTPGRSASPSLTSTARLPWPGTGRIMPR